VPIHRHAWIYTLGDTAVFLFAFQLLKLVPDVVGVALFALGAAFLLLLPFLDGNPRRGAGDRAWTAAFVLLLASVLVLEVLALASPGAKHPPEPLAAETYRRYDSLVSLGLLWLAIGFVVYYLGQLVNENARVRRLYSGDRAEKG
jgi:quinol-cytochrome oxidoreductase complex cytochrome b subunit